MARSSPLAQVLPVKPVTRPCQKEGCRAWARRDGTFCSSHSPRPKTAKPTIAPPPGQSAAQAGSAANQCNLLEFFRDVFSPEEYKAVNRLVTTNSQPMAVEMSIIRVLLRRVMQRIGTDDPAKALPLVRQAVDAMCRTLRTQRVLSGEAGQTFADTLSTLLEQWGELAAPDQPAETGAGGEKL